MNHTITFNHRANTFYESLSISLQRKEELNKIIFHTWLIPGKRSEKLEVLVGVARDFNEMVWLVTTYTFVESKMDELTSNAGDLEKILNIILNKINKDDLRNTTSN